MENTHGNTIPTGGQAPRKFLFVGREGLSGDLAWRVAKEGNAVKMAIADEEEKDVFDGFVEKVDDWKAALPWADVVVFEDTGYGSIADALRKEGKLVVGGGVYADKLEVDREFGQTEMKSVGIQVVPHWDLGNFDSAIEIIKQNPDRYAFKPSGDIPSEQKGILFIGQEEDGRDIIEVLEHNKKSWAKKFKKFQLQQFISGVEVAVGAFFNGKEFIYPVCVNFEHKKLFPGDIGPSTGEMGTLMFWAGKEHAVFKATLAKMEEKLKSSGYVGYIDINCIANTKGVYPLEFTCRFGYPTISIQMEGMTGPVGDFLFALASGIPHELKTKRGFQIGVVIAVPPFPYNDKGEFEIYKDFSIIFKKPVLDGVHLGDVKLVDGDWHLAGETGYALVVTGSDSTVEGARKQVYKRIGNIMLQNMFYRTDIGLQWYHESDKLQTWGYL